MSDHWIRQCCCPTSFFQRSDRCWLLLVAFFVRICGCMTWHKVWLSHIIKHPWKPNKLITAHWEEWVLLGENQGTDVVRVCRQPPPCKNRQSRGPSHCQYACSDVARCMRLLAPVLVVLHGLGRQTKLPDRRVVRARDRCKSENPLSERSNKRPPPPPLVAPARNSRGLCRGHRLTAMQYQ